MRPSAAALETAESMLKPRPAAGEIPARLAAALIRLALSRRTGDFEAATAAAGRAGLGRAVARGGHARHPGLGAQLLSGHGTVELWAGRLDAAAADFTDGGRRPVHQKRSMRVLTAWGS